MNYIYRVLFMSVSLSSVWDHSVHFAKTDINVIKKDRPHTFIQFQTNIMENMVNGMGGYRYTGYYFWRFAERTNTGLYGAENFKTLLLEISSDLIQTLEDIGYDGGKQAITFLSNGVSFKHFEAILSEIR